LTKYGQFCPVAKAAEVFAERWTPLILREIVCGSHRFNELESGLPKISRSLLTSRLRSLERAGVIERHPVDAGQTLGYYLTDAGAELGNIVVTLGEWGQRWVNHDVGPADLDLDLLLWDLHRRLKWDEIPAARIVVRFDFSGAQFKTYWLVLDHGEASVCLGDPGFETDLYVSADTVAFHRVWIGRARLADAMRDDLVRIEGPSDLVRAFPSWLAFSLFAHIHLSRRRGAASRHNPTGDAK
jgi:DNA-binding HxlR family transcriptional regulator